METTFIYGLYDPRTNELRYIGKANDPEYRLGCHIREVKWKSRIHTSHKNNWIKGLLKEDLKPYAKILREVPANEWKMHEIEIIAEAKKKGHNLVNSTLGGEGVKSHVFTEEHKRRLSESHKGGVPWNLGTHLTKEHKEKISLANRGYSHTEESKKKMSDKIKLSWEKRNYRMSEKQIEARKNRGPLSEETKRKISQAKMGNTYGRFLKGIPKTEEHKRNISLGIRKKKEK